MGRYEKIRYTGNRNRTLGHAYVVIFTPQLTSSRAWVCLNLARHCLRMAQWRHEWSSTRLARWANPINSTAL